MSTCLGCGKWITREDDTVTAGKDGEFHAHCVKSPTQERSNDLIGRSEPREHEADAEGKACTCPPPHLRVSVEGISAPCNCEAGGNQGERSEATTRAIGAESEQLLMPCRVNLTILDDTCLDCCDYIIKKANCKLCGVDHLKKRIRAGRS